MPPPGLNRTTGSTDTGGMPKARNPMPRTVAAHTADNKRRHGRIACELLTCTIGEVQDLSASGLRVRHRGRVHVKIGDTVDLSLRILDDRIPLRAKIVWLKRVRFFSHEIGLEFVDLSEQARNAIHTVARVAQRSCMAGDKD